jgi:hypothetical protein
LAQEAEGCRRIVRFQRSIQTPAQCVGVLFAADANALAQEFGAARCITSNVLQTMYYKRCITSDVLQAMYYKRCIAVECE